MEYPTKLCFVKRILMDNRAKTVIIMKSSFINIQYTYYIATYLYRKPAESEYGDHDDDHSGYSLLASPALSRRWLPTRVHSFPQSHQHQHVEDAYDCQWYRVRCEKEEYLKF